MMSSDTLPYANPFPTPPVTVFFRPSRGQESLSCWLAIPAKAAAGQPPLVAVHGIRRRAQVQAEQFAARAAALGRPVIAPLFDASAWPNYQQVVRTRRADLALLDLLTELRLMGLWHGAQFDLFGYSGGAQFAHRFAMLFPHLVSRLIVASAGWYTFPDSAPFPYGVAEGPGRIGRWGPHLGAGLDRFLRLSIQVCVGADDSVRDPNTRIGPDLDRQQGTTRLTRAQGWVRALRAAARARAITPRVALAVLPGCGHDFETCVVRGGLDRIVLPDGDPEPRPYVHPCQPFPAETPPPSAE